MSTSMKRLMQWHQRGIDQKADYMIVACDQFDYEDYPVYVDGSVEDAVAKKKEIDGKSMTKVMEAYDLSKPFMETEVLEMAF